MASSLTSGGGALFAGQTEKRLRNAVLQRYFRKVLFTVLYVNKIDCVAYLDSGAVCLFVYLY